MKERRLDLRGLKCPLPVLYTRKALARMPAGGILIVTCSDPMSQIDIPHLVAQSGDVLEERGDDDGAFTFHLRKRTA